MIDDMRAVFNNNLGILKNSIDSMDMERFEKLLSDAEAVLRKNGKIIVSGLGKNVPVCDKVVGSMVSLGLNANFLHTNSAVHGDMGMVKSGDLVILLSKSGSTQESVYLANLLQKREGVNLWVLTFQRKSKLTDMIGDSKCLALDLKHEGDLWNVMPNNSTILNLIVLQTLAMQLANRLELQLERDFKPNHPGGAIGELLR